MPLLQHYLGRLQYYIDKIEEHLPFKPSKWKRKYKIAIVCLGVLFLIMVIVGFALHDEVCPAQSY